MKIITIKSTKNEQTLYEGQYHSVKDCVESAINQKIDLAYADLSYQNLVGASLDGGSFNEAVFTGCNLNSANMSEIKADTALFDNASLKDACFCFSSLKHCRFDGALFGATDIAGSDIDGARFDGQSSLSLNFIDTNSQNLCLYNQTGVGESSDIISFSRPPMVIHGLSYPIVKFDNHIKLGSLIIERSRWPDFIEKPGTFMSTKEGRLFNFILRHRSLIEHLGSDFKNCDSVMAA